MFDHVLVPVDLTDRNRRALEAAARLAGEDGEVTLLHVIETLDLPFDELEDFYQRLHDRAQVEMDQMADPLSVSGVTVIQNVLETHPETKFLALSVSDSPEDVIAMIRAGARGYVTKSIGPAELVDAVKRVADGDAVFSPRLAGFVLDAFGGAISPASDPELDQLTPREKEVLRLIARGLAYKQVARKLNISIKTVETHVSSVLRKLQLSSRHELARWASDRRIV